MADPATPAAGTPPADPPAGGQPASNNLTPAANQPPGNNQPPTQTPTPQTFTQEQVDAIFNKRWGEKMADIEKELGLQAGGLKDFVAAQKKPQTPPVGSTDPLTGAELRMAKMEALMLAGVPSKKIPGLLSRVQGKTKADIETDVKFMITEGFIVLEESKQAAQPQQQPPTQAPPTVAAQGAGSPGVPPGPKTWVRAELSKLSPEEYEKHRSEIHAALRDGRVK